MLGSAISWISNNWKASSAKWWLLAIICIGLGASFTNVWNSKEIRETKASFEAHKSSHENDRSRWAFEKKRLETESLELRTQLDERAGKIAALEAQISSLLENTNVIANISAYAQEHTRLENLKKQLLESERQISSYEAIKSIYEGLPYICTNMTLLNLVYDYHNKREICDEVVNDKLARASRIEAQLLNHVNAIVQLRVKELDRYKRDVATYRTKESELLVSMLKLYITISKLKDHFSQHIIKTTDHYLDKNLLEEATHFRAIIAVPFPCEKNFESLLASAMEVDVTNVSALDKVESILSRHLESCGHSNK